MQVELDFMVVPEHLTLFGKVLNPVRCKIISLEGVIEYNLLGESGLKLAAAGAEFLFNEPLANELIERGVVEKV